MSLRRWKQRVKGNNPQGARRRWPRLLGGPLNANRRGKQMASAAQRLATPNPGCPTHAFTAGLRLGGAGSCLTTGETMAGWGIPEVGRPGWAGATM